MPLSEYRRGMVSYVILLTSWSELVIFPTSSPLSTLSTRTQGTYSATLWFASVVDLTSPEQLLTHYNPLWRKYYTAQLFQEYSNRNQEEIT
jgi:hypothetical protein